jgi:hypothetical protein
MELNVDATQKTPNQALAMVAGHRNVSRRGVLFSGRKPKVIHR